MTAERPDSARRTGPALESMYQFLVWLVPTLEKFPRSQRFLLGDRIESCALDALEGLIDATYSRNRLERLTVVNLRLEKMRFLLRLSCDLRYLDERRYEHAARAVDDIGRLVGGWMKAHRAQTS